MLLTVCASVVLARAGISASSQILFMSFVVIVVVGGFILHLFRRRIGGIDPRTGRPGGSEPEIVAVLWFLAALAGALYITYSPSEAVG